MSGYRFDKLKILVVDDNVHMRKLVITILQAFGVDADLSRPRAASAPGPSCARHNPDVVRAGLGDGRHVGHRTRPACSAPIRQAPNPFVPVIMLTGHTQIDQVREARDAGINEFIAKPVSVKTMMSGWTR